MGDPSFDANLPNDVPGTSGRIETNGITLHTVRAGPDDGPLVMLLHGFPEFWYGWHNQIRPLAEAGYRVVVPDQRGYNLSEKPAGVDNYHIDELARDVVGLIDAEGRDRATIVGHDWGAAVGWWTALHYPDRVATLCAVNVPHPSVMAETLRRSWEQRFKSWYILAFQLPTVPEAIARFGNWRLLTAGMRRSSIPGTFTREDFDRYREAWSRPNAFESMVNWYRATGRYRPAPERDRVEVPTLVLWGRQDEFLKTSMAHESVDRCADGQLVTFDGATHWVLHEEPVRTAEELLRFFEEGTPKPPNW